MVWSGIEQMTQGPWWGLWVYIEWDPSDCCIERRGIGGKRAEGDHRLGSPPNALAEDIMQADIVVSQRELYQLNDWVDFGGWYWAMHHYKHLPWGWLHCEGCGGEHSKIREELEKLTSLVPDPDSMGHNSSTSLSMSYWMTSSWLLSSWTEFPNDDKIRLDDHYGSSCHNILQLIHSQSLSQTPPTVATILAAGVSVRTFS